MSGSTIKNTVRTCSVALATVALAVSAIACVPAQASSNCDPEVETFGVDDGVILRCHNTYAASRVWVPEYFNEEPLTVSKLGELLALADGPMADVRRVAVVGDEVLHGITSIDPAARNPEPYEVHVELEWPTAAGGRPCNRIGEPVVEPVIDDEVVTARVTWTERVGGGRFQFCGEPRPHMTVTDANGDPVPVAVLVA